MKSVDIRFKPDRFLSTLLFLLLPKMILYRLEMMLYRLEIVLYRLEMILYRLEMMLYRLEMMLYRLEMILYRLEIVLYRLEMILRHCTLTQSLQFIVSIRKIYRYPRLRRHDKQDMEKNHKCFQHSLPRKTSGHLFENDSLIQGRGL